MDEKVDLEVQEEKVFEQETVKKVIEPNTSKKAEGKKQKAEKIEITSKYVMVMFTRNSLNAGKTKKLPIALAKKLEANDKIKIVSNA